MKRLVLCGLVIGGYMYVLERFKRRTTVFCAYNISKRRLYLRNGDRDTEVLTYCS